MALLVRARLSLLDDDEDDAATASSLSSAASSPPLSPSRAAVLAAPRVAAQLSSTEEDASESFDDATSSGEDAELAEEVSNGFFFTVARVPPPPPPPAPEDPSPVPGGETAGPAAAATEGGNDSGATEGSLEESYMSAESGLDGVIADGNGTGTEGSLDGSFQSSGSSIGALSGGEAAASGGDLVNGSTDVPVLLDGVQGEQDVVAEAVNDVPAVAGDYDLLPIVDDLEGKGEPDREVVELLHVPGATQGEDAGIELHNDYSNSDAKDSVVNREAGEDAEGASPKYVVTRDVASHAVEVRENVNHRDSIADGDHNKEDEEADGDHDISDDCASLPISASDDAVELLVKEMEENNVAASKGTHFGLDDSDDVDINGDEYEGEMNGKEVELFDYAALVELLRAANRSPGQGKAKVFPVEPSEPRHLLPAVSSIPRTDMTSTPVLEVTADPENDMTDEEKKIYRKVDMARIKYMRLIHRLGYDTNHLVPVQVLYRLSLVEGSRRIRMGNHSSELDNAWKRALQLEAEGIEDLEFSCNVLVLGKTGVGKSATINSIFDEDKTKTDAFLPATSSVKEITGVVDGVKFRVIDTPGLGSSARDEKLNRKVLNSIKKYMKRCPPDIILYVDRIDTQRQEANSLFLLQGITSVLGQSIWPRTIITLTHSGATPPEGPSGSAMNYGMVVTHRTRTIQQSIRQVTNDSRLENPVALVENHHLCQRNTKGEKVLPDGLTWRRLLLLLCYSKKMIAEIDSLSNRRASSPSLLGHLFQVPPLPYFLSSLLRAREHPRCSIDHNVGGVDSDFDLDELLNGEEEDEYDQLPPFKPLSKSQVAKLSKEQQKLYFDEYDYRTKLLQEKQLKEQLIRSKQMEKKGGDENDVPYEGDHPDDEYDTDKSPMPDWSLPSSFDSDDPVYRYRCLEPTPNLLVRAVNNPDGWDHDYGFDGVSIQHSLDIGNKYPASLWVQVNKDKSEFTIHLDSSMSVKHGDYASSLAGFDIQTMMDQLAYTLRGETKFKNFKKNITTGGLAMTFLGNTMVTGARVEDKLLVGNRLTLVANTGAVSMRGDAACGLNVEATLREKSYPVGQGLATLGASLVKWHKEWIMAANLDSQFSVGRTSNMAVHVDVNNKLTGRVSIKASTSEQLKIALLGCCSAIMYLLNKMHPGAGPKAE